MLRRPRRALSLRHKCSSRAARATSRTAACNGSRCMPCDTPSGWIRSAAVVRARPPGGLPLVTASPVKVLAPGSEAGTGVRAAGVDITACFRESSGSIFRRGVGMQTRPQSAMCPRVITRVGESVLRWSGSLGSMASDAETWKSRRGAVPVKRCDDAAHCYESQDALLRII